MFVTLTATLLALAALGRADLLKTYDKMNNGVNYDAGSEFGYQRVNPINTPHSNLDVYFPTKINWWAQHGKKFGNLNVMPMVPMPVTNSDMANIELANLEATKELEHQLNQHRPLSYPSNTNLPLQPLELDSDPESGMTFSPQRPEKLRPYIPRKLHHPQKHRQPPQPQPDDSELPEENVDEKNQPPLVETPLYKTVGTVQNIGIFDLGPMCPRGFERVGNICRRKSENQKKLNL